MINVTIENYQELAMRTMNNTLSKELQLAQAITGMHDELGEVADLLITGRLKKSGKDEMGDVLWYVAELCELTGLQLSTIYQELIDDPTWTLLKSNTDKLFKNMVRKASDVSSPVKKHLFQGHELNVTLVGLQIKDFLTSYMRLVLFHTDVKSIEEIMSGNVEKLVKRYPEGFSTELSVNREE